MRWRPHLSATSSIVLRVLLLADGVLLVGVGIVAVIYVDHPAGLYLAGGMWLAAGVLFGLLPLTDPYRRDRHRSTW